MVGLIQQPSLLNYILNSLLLQLRLYWLTSIFQAVYQYGPLEVIRNQETEGRVLSFQFLGTSYQKHGFLVWQFFLIALKTEFSDQLLSYGPHPLPNQTHASLMLLTKWFGPSMGPSSKLLSFNYFSLCLCSLAHSSLAGATTNTLELSFCYHFNYLINNLIPS